MSVFDTVADVHYRHKILDLVSRHTKPVIEAKIAEWATADSATIDAAGDVWIARGESGGDFMFDRYMAEFLIWMDT